MVFMSSHTLTLVSTFVTFEYGVLALVGNKKKLQDFICSKDLWHLKNDISYII